MKYRIVYLIISGLVILLGIFSLLKWGLKYGVDFKGGTIAEYSFDKAISTEDLSSKLKENGIDVSAIQNIGETKYLFRFSPLSSDAKEKVMEVLNASLQGGKVDELRFETVGPSIGPELIKKTIYAITLAASAILLWVAFQFKSWKFGTSAVLAMFHDSIVLIGIYSLFSHFFDAEVDFLFVTALLTTLSFSVHDTIVVYDRIRESQRRIGGSLYDLANKAVTETMVRSLNNSFTIVFMLIALILLGGSTIKWFAVALLIGTVSGTYSSPFVAVTLLVTWDEWIKKVRRK